MGTEELRAAVLQEATAEATALIEAPLLRLHNLSMVRGDSWRKIPMPG